MAIANKITEVAKSAKQLLKLRKEIVHIEDTLERQGGVLERRIRPIVEGYFRGYAKQSIKHPVIDKFSLQIVPENAEIKIHINVHEAHFQSSSNTVVFLDHGQAQSIRKELGDTFTHHQPNVVRFGVVLNYDTQL